MDALSLLDFPPTLADAAGRVRSAAGKIYALRQRPTALWEFQQDFILTNINFIWRIVFTRRKDKKILFWFKQESIETVVVNCLLTMKLLPKDPASAPTTLTAENLKTVYEAPPFLIEVNDAEFTQFAPAGAKRDESIVLRLNSGRTLVFSELKNKVATGNPPRAAVTDGEKKTTHRLNKRLPDTDLADLLDTFGDWSREHTSGAITSLELDTKNDAGQLLRAILDAYVIALEKAEGDGNEITPYAIACYEATVQLRLDQDGFIAAEDSGDWQFELSVNVSIEETPRGHVATLKPLPPDFLISGKIFELFWQTLQDFSEDTYEDEFEFETQEAWLRFLAGARETACIFRIREDDDDTDVVFLSGLVDGKSFTLIFSAKFRVRSGPDPSVEFREDVEVLAPRDDDDEDSGDIEKYVVRLAASLRYWRESFE